MLALELRRVLGVTQFVQTLLELVLLDIEHLGKLVMVLGLLVSLPQQGFHWRLFLLLWLLL